MSKAHGKPEAARPSEEAGAGLPRGWQGCRPPGALPAMLSHWPTEAGTYTRGELVQLRCAPLGSTVSSRPEGGGWSWSRPSQTSWPAVPHHMLPSAQDGPAAPITWPAGGLRQLVGRHLVHHSSNAAVAFAPPRGPRWGFPAPGHSRTQAVQHQGPAETAKCPSDGTQEGLELWWLMPRSGRPGQPRALAAWDNLHSGQSWARSPATRPLSPAPLQGCFCGSREF